MTVSRKVLGIGVVGFGWMGMAHSRSAARIASLFPQREFNTRLVICGDNVSERRQQAVDGFGFASASADWESVVNHPDVDVVYVTAPNMMHEEVATAAAKAGKAVFCEKPVGGTPDQTVRIEAAARAAGVITGVGYNYRWAPLVRHARNLIESGALGEITNYRGRFFSMYGADPMGLLSWRFLVDEAGYGVSSDILSHAVDLATMLVGPITRVSGTMETFIKDRPLPMAGGTHYDRGSPGDPTGAVTNEDYAAAMVTFANGARGTFESSRAIIGPESQMAFDIYGTKGALRWNLETMNEMDIFIVDESGTAPRGYTKVYAGDRYPYHGHFVPGDANAIGYEDLKVIENYEFLTAVAKGEQHEPGFAEALDYVSFQSAWLRSCDSGSWEDVSRLGAP
ncbi:MAG: Gfo/Idh/MocA family oxidoreductase [Ilumatobacteraceae bacterium]|nr:Gfo/Idh/MocA family oxidoreductase [Ilumatobacteraceae bacterium]